MLSWCTTASDAPERRTRGCTLILKPLNCQQPDRLGGRTCRTTPNLAKEPRMNDTKHHAPGQRRMIAKLPAPWTRTTAAHRCPVCRRAGCLVSSPKSPAAVICTRTKSPRPIGTAGYLHVLRDGGPTWAPWRTSLVRLAHHTGQPMGGAAQRPQVAGPRGPRAARTTKSTSNVPTAPTSGVRECGAADSSVPPASTAPDPDTADTPVKLGSDSAELTSSGSAASTALLLNTALFRSACNNNTKP